MRGPTRVLFLLAVIISCSRPAAAQATEPVFDASLIVVGTSSSEFDTSDVGIGGRLGWRPRPILSAEAELTVYPGGFPDGAAFSGGRVEGLFGVTVGPRLPRLRPFAKMRPGFVTFQEAPEPVACILIFPPPLSCVLAGGKTVFALDVGGGVELLPTARLVIRVDAGDRMLRYPRERLGTGGAIEDAAFFSHDVRFAAGVGVRF
jgi:hypothetical protein